MPSLDNGLCESEGPAANLYVIARPQAAAISWYNVQILTQYQEIATPLWGSQ